MTPSQLLKVEWAKGSEPPGHYKVSFCNYGARPIPDLGNDRESWKTTNEYGFLGGVESDSHDSRFLIEQGVCSNEIWRARISRAILSISC
jgi:hypothetical protein